MDQVDEEESDQEDDTARKSVRFETTDMKNKKYQIQNQIQLRKQRDQDITNVGINGYFRILKRDGQHSDMIKVDQHAFDVSEATRAHLWLTEPLLVFACYSLDGGQDLRV